jgi:hypothetical protein
MNFESSSAVERPEDRNQDVPDKKVKAGLIKRIGGITLAVALAAGGLSSCEGNKNREVYDGQGGEIESVEPEVDDDYHVESHNEGAENENRLDKKAEEAKCNKWLDEFFISPKLKFVIDKKYRGMGLYAEIYTSSGERVGVVSSIGTKGLKFSEASFVFVVSELLEKNDIKFKRNYPLFDIGEKSKKSGEVNVEPSVMLVADNLRDKGLEYGYVKKGGKDVLVFRNNQEGTIVKNGSDLFDLEIDMDNDRNPKSHTEIYVDLNGEINISGTDESGETYHYRIGKTEDKRNSHVIIREIK